MKLKALDSFIGEVFGGFINWKKLSARLPPVDY